MEGTGAYSRNLRDNQKTAVITNHMRGIRAGYRHKIKSMNGEYQTQAVVKFQIGMFIARVLSAESPEKIA